MTNFYPENSAAMLQAIYDWVRTEAAPVRAMWKKQQAPALALPYVALELLVPPVEEGNAERTHLGFAVRVKTVANSTTYTVTINGVAFPFPSGIGATAASIRDGLIAAIAAGSQPVEAEAFTADALTILPEPGELAPTVAVDANLELGAPEVLLGYAVGTVAIDVYADDLSAAAIAKKLELSLDKLLVIAALHEAGWAIVDVQDVRRLDEFADGRWEDRVGFDVRMRCRSRAVVVVGFVEHADVDQGIVGTLSP